MTDLNEIFRAATKTERSIMVRKARIIGLRLVRLGGGYSVNMAAAVYAPCTNLYYAFYDGVREAQRIAMRTL